MPSTRKPIDRDAIRREYEAYGIPFIGGGEQTAEEIAAAAKLEADAKAAADAKAKEEADALEAAGIKTDAGKEALRKERDARAKAEKDAKDANERIAAFEAEKREREEADRKAAEEAAIKRGEFEKLANDRGEELSKAAQERDALRTERDELVAAMKSDVETAWQELPDEIKAFYAGADGDIVAMKKFLTKSQPAIEKFASQQTDEQRRLRGVPPNLKPNKSVPGDNDEKARQQFATGYTG